MPKPNVNSNLTQIKAYIREHNLNKPEIKLGMRKAELVAGLKKHGHWDSRVKSKKDTNLAVRTGGAPTHPLPKKKKKKKLSQGQKDFLSGIH